MLTGGTDSLYRSVLAGPRHEIVRLEVWRDGVRIDTYGNDGLPFIDGAVQATLAQQVTRTMSFSIDESFWPGRDPNALLAPWGNEIRAFAGVRPGAGVPFMWPVFRGRINEPSLDTSGLMTVPCVDRAGDVKDSGFQAPTNSQTGTTIGAQFRLLVSDGVNDATFGSFDIDEQFTPDLTWEWDRSSACDDCASAVGGYWYALANGDYVIRKIPWTVDQTPVVTLTDGEGGLLYEAVPSLVRDNVFNVVSVVGERADTTTPVYATVMDSDPSSITYEGGAFGRKTKLIRVQAAINQGQALALAQVALQQAKALTEIWTVSMAPDASLELGDAVYIQARGLPPIAQVLASFTYPLMSGSPMTAAFRALQPLED